MDKTSALPIILIDGSSYLFRAYHALPPLTNSKGTPTGAIYGVLNMLRKLLKDYAPSHIAVIFDSKSKNFRHQKYPQYKANRSVMPDELQVQIQPLFDSIRALGLPFIVVEGVEADDVIGTLAKHAQQHGFSVLISTGDKDLAQLVNPHVTLVNTMTQQVLDETGVREKFGVTPVQMIDYLALTGDTVDNIPGVPGVGPKTAVNWLNQYHSLENLLQNADKIPGKVGENLRSHIEQVLLGKELVTIQTDVPLPCAIPDLTVMPADTEKLRELFTELEFKTWLQDLPATVVPARSNESTIILDPAALSLWLKSAASSPLFGIRFETAEKELVGIALALPDNGSAYIPLAHHYSGAPEQLSLEWVLSQLTVFLEDPHKIMVGENLKSALKILGQNNLSIKAKLWDSVLASYVLDNGGAKHDIGTLAFRCLSQQIMTFEDIAGKGAKQLAINQVPIEQTAAYSTQSVDALLGVYSLLQPKLQANAELQFVFDRIEMPLMPLLAKMEQAGVLIDAEKLRLQSQSLQQRIQALEEEVYTLSGEEFNLNSAKQLQEVLYSRLGLPVLKKTPTGQPSTSEEVLQELALQYPIPQFILTFRSLSKLKSTYTDRLPEEIDPRTGRVHTSYHQAVTSTGRLSSSDPNLQNIPVRSEEGRKIRQAFIAPLGYKILAADYSQVELRIMAHLSQDPGLLEAFTQGLDVHRSTAAQVHGIALEQVTADQRRNAKAVNFGLLYGMSSFGLANQLGISREEAQKYIDAYFKQYPRVREYMEQARALAAKQGYAKTLFGRRVQVPDIKASNQFRRLAAERQAINAPLQGTAADIIKLAMIQIDDCLTRRHADARLIMQVHDELVFEVAENEVEAVTREVRQCMEQVITLSVPLIVDTGIGTNWDEAH